MADIFYSRVYTNKFGTRLWEGIFYSERIFGLHEAQHSDAADVTLSRVGAHVATFSSVGGNYDMRVAFVKREHILERYKNRHAEPATPEALAKVAIGMLFNAPVVEVAPPDVVRRLLQKGRAWSGR